jgi:hypothetical protein
LAVAAASPDTINLPRIYVAKTVVKMKMRKKSPAILAVFRGD